MTVAKAIGFDDHIVRQLKQTAKDIPGTQSDIHFILKVKILQLCRIFGFPEAAEP